MTTQSEVSEAKGDPDTDTASAALLALCELFADIDWSFASGLSSEIRMIHIQASEILMEQGEHADCMYGVIGGRLEMFVQIGGESRFLGEVSAGETIGENDLIGAGARFATVRAVRDSSLVRVSRSAFERILLHDPSIGRRLAQTLANRMRRLAESETTGRAARTIAIMGAGEGAPIAEFAESLCRALSSFGKVFHGSRSHLQNLFPNTAAARLQQERRSGAINWLTILEGEYEFVVYETDSSPTPWTLHCLRQADCILAVGRARTSPELNAVEEAVFAIPDAGMSSRAELVLLHHADQPPSGTSEWLARRSVRRHHHIRSSVTADIERVARIVCGKAIGLVLGGGGARGYAHIGIIRAMEEAGVSIDFICGVSMGSILAAQYALHWDWQTMLRRSRQALGKTPGRLTLPMVSLSSGRKLQKALRGLFDNIQVEDLWLNYFCVSCNLTTSEAVVHRRGSLWKCLNASNAVPAVLPPVLDGGHMLVDGGILNNQPGDVLKELCGGRVVVSNVSPQREMMMDSALTEMPSPWRVLWSRINPFAQKMGVPGIAALVTHTLMVASQRKSREVERIADFYLRPPIDHFGLLESSRMEEIAEVGYEYAKKEIATWGIGEHAAAAPMGGL